MTEQLTAMKNKLSPLSLKDAPSLIERLFPAQKISAEAQKERNAGTSQTLTALGSYWKGRKPLVLNKACILGALLPATDEPEKDLAIFELLMAIDEESFTRRAKSVKIAETVGSLAYLERLKVCYRCEELDDAALYGSIWTTVNDHLGTSARSFPELVEQLGIMRFGHRTRVSDPFSGSGQIPFEAARLGCDVYASDLNPIACMLTWAGFNVVGTDSEKLTEIQQSQQKIADVIDCEITDLGIEHDELGNRAKAYLYCLETRCPNTGWMVPLSRTWVISVKWKTVAKLVPNFETKMFDIVVISNASDDEIEMAALGTVKDDSLVYSLKGEEYRSSIKSIRGDYKQTDGTMANKLRHWEKSDFKPRREDIFQERLYAIQWMTKETLNQSRPETFFTAVRPSDLSRERKVETIVQQNLLQWQTEGLIPDMAIESGYNTDQPIRERGWTYWHHLFSPRALLVLSLKRKYGKSVYSLLQQARDADRLCKLCRYNPNPQPTQGPKIEQVFSNQALNPLLNYGLYSFAGLDHYFDKIKSSPINSSNVEIDCGSASDKNFLKDADLFISDPPYADAINYHEITEFFIGWLRKNVPSPFDGWAWDSRRALAIKGSGIEFKRDMVAAYQNMACHMSDNGMQIVMFTHQDSGVWSDMAAIMWGAGLQVTAAWYIATETTSEQKKGGYVQGTVLLILRKRVQESSAYRDELVQEVKSEVVRQLDTLLGLNQTVKGQGRTENLFEDADLQMAGYAAALRVLTAYTHIDGRDMTAEALRPREKGDKGVVGEIIDFAVQVANEHLVPEGLLPAVWEILTSSERFYLKMLDIESAGVKKLDNYQNFAKAFRLTNYTALMSSTKPNAARLKTGLEFKKAEFDGEFGQSVLRALLFALFEIQKELDADEVMNHLRDMVPGYHNRRDELMALARYIAAKREESDEKEAEAARILLGCIQNERLGG